MNKITLIYTARPWNPGSWLIRWALPRSRFAMALCSHCMILDDDHVIEATMLHGVRRVPALEALNNVTVVGWEEYEVADAEAGLAWARNQINLPYDFAGAFGLALAPDRDWMKEDAWFCFELGAAALAHAGRAIFRQAGHVNGNMLLAIKP